MALTDERFWIRFTDAEPVDGDVMVRVDLMWGDFPVKSLTQATGGVPAAALYAQPEQGAAQLVAALFAS